MEESIEGSGPASGTRSGLASDSVNGRGLSSQGEVGAMDGMGMRGPLASASVASLSSMDKLALENTVRELEIGYKNRSEVCAYSQADIGDYGLRRSIGGRGRCGLRLQGKLRGWRLATELHQGYLAQVGNHKDVQPSLSSTGCIVRPAAYLAQPALMGKGAAVFADVSQEFLDV
ncbi:hypothetical protein BU15DRAFT_59612 [Melanogaster broomeanus]|nr:hypothetical protein BU15DRAFT_59612 [Melanogaster broomeanus]